MSDDKKERWGEVRIPRTGKNDPGAFLRGAFEEEEKPDDKMRDYVERVAAYIFESRIEALETLEGLLQEHDLKNITLPPDYVTTMRRLVDQWNGK